MNNIENQSLEPKKRNGRRHTALKSKSKRVPVALLDSIDKLLAVHKQHSTDGRKHARVPGAAQTRFVDCSEVRQIPLEYWEVVTAMIAAWRAERRKSHTRKTKA